MKVIEASKSSKITVPKQKVKFWVVTSCTPQYLPGLLALRNSLELFFPESSLACFMYSQEQDLDLPERVHYIHEAPMLGTIVNNGGDFREGLKLGPDMYSRLLIPKYFKGRVFYVDVDCAVLGSLSEAWELDMQNKPTACVLREDIGWIGGHIEDKMASGTFLCDTEKWEELSMVEKVFKVMDDYSKGLIQRKFNVNVESSLGYAHENNFLPLNRKYQNLAYYGNLSKEDKIIHWGGPKPWKINNHSMPSKDANYVDLWTALYKQDTEKVKELVSYLPDTLANKVLYTDRNRIRKKGVKIL